MATSPGNDSAGLNRIYAWFSAVITEDTQLMQDLLAHGVPVDVPHPLRHSTALMEATRLGRIATVLWLLEHGATPAFLCGVPPGTPLHAAIRLKHWAIARLLIAAKDSCEAIDNRGQTSLHILAAETVDGKEIADAIDVGKLLIAKKCPLDALDDDGTAALHLCVLHDLPDLAELLLASGANANIQIPNTGVTPLTIAALEKNLTLASILLRHGANPHIKTVKGKCAATIFPNILRLNEYSPATALASVPDEQGNIPQVH